LTIKAARSVAMSLLIGNPVDRLWLKVWRSWCSGFPLSRE
jgi:hypothetical protein